MAWIDNEMGNNVYVQDGMCWLGFNGPTSERTNAKESVELHNYRDKMFLVRDRDVEGGKNEWVGG